MSQIGPRKEAAEAALSKSSSYSEIFSRKESSRHPVQESPNTWRVTRKMHLDCIQAHKERQRPLDRTLRASLCAGQFLRLF